MAFLKAGAPLSHWLDTSCEAFEADGLFELHHCKLTLQQSVSACLRHCALMDRMLEPHMQPIAWAATYARLAAASAASQCDMA